MMEYLTKCVCELSITPLQACKSVPCAKCEAWHSAGQRHPRAKLHLRDAPANVSTEREQLTKDKQSIDAFVGTWQNKTSVADSAKDGSPSIVYPAGGTKQVPLHLDLFDGDFILLSTKSAIECTVTGSSADMLC